MAKLYIIKSLMAAKKDTIKLPKLKSVYTYADPKDNQRIQRSLDRNKRRNVK